MSVTKSDGQCSICSKFLTPWDYSVFKALKYRHPYCISCMAEEYDMNADEFNKHMQSYQGLRPCLFDE